MKLSTMSAADKLKWGKRYKRFHRKFIKALGRPTTGSDLVDCRREFMAKNNLE